MKLVEKHYIKSSNLFFEEMDNLSFLSKNIYNVANYIIRQEFIKEGEYLGAYDIQKLLQGKDKDYIKLPAKVSQQIIKLLDKNWKSFFKAIKEYKKNPDKFLGRPKLPGYKEKQGRNIVIYDKQAISKIELKKGIVRLSQTSIFLPFSNKLIKKKIKQVRIIPVSKILYCIEIVYEKKEKELSKSKNIAGIDLGLNNLSVITFSKKGTKPRIINGRPLKSINQYYNKRRAELSEKLTKEKVSWKNIKSKQRETKKLMKLSNKRNMKVNDYLHKASRKIIDLCLTKNIGRIIIGNNKNWKQNVNLGKRNNQNFVNIPFAKYIEMISYKGKLEGIDVVVTEESYTSKCSFIDNETLIKHKKYKGKRIKRGLFRSKDRIFLNADVNGSYNIIRKVVPKFSIEKKGIEGIAVYPLALAINE